MRRRMEAQERQERRRERGGGGVWGQRGGRKMVAEGRLRWRREGCGWLGVQLGVGCE